MVTESKNQLVIDDKYLSLLGYPPEGITNTVSDSGQVIPGNTQQHVISSELPAVINSGGGRLINSGGGGGNAAVDSPNAANGFAFSIDDQHRLHRQPQPPHIDGGVAINDYAKSDYAAAGVVSSSSSAAGSVWPAAADTTKLTNFSLVSYVLANQLASALQLVKNLNAAVPSEHLLLYDLGLSADDHRSLLRHCYPVTNASALATSAAAASNVGVGGVSGPQTGEPPVRVVNLYNDAGSVSGGYNAYSVMPNLDAALNPSPVNVRCRLVKLDLVAIGFPSYVIDDAQMHAFRPLLIRDALRRWARTVLFVENSVRLRPNTANDLSELRRQVEASASGVKGWRTEPTMAVSSRTHLKMYEYFHTDDDNFKFLKMLSLDALLFTDTVRVNQRILLPWIKCALLPECIHPIGEYSRCCCC